MKKNKEKFGFTMVEVLVSISILSIAILATFTAVSNSLKASNFTEDQITAYYLADEALEYIRNRRDSNFIRHIKNLETGGNFNWLSTIASVSTDPCFFGNTCYVSVPLDLIVRCSGACPSITYDTNTGFYSTSGGTATPFRRSITMTQFNSSEVSVVVQISWTSQGITKNHMQTLVLRNWAE